MFFWRSAVCLCFPLIFGVTKLFFVLNLTFVSFLFFLFYSQIHKQKPLISLFFQSMVSFWWNSAMSVMPHDVAASAFERIVQSFPDPCTLLNLTLVFCVEIQKEMPSMKVKLEPDDVKKFVKSAMSLKTWLGIMIRKDMDKTLLQIASNGKAELELVPCGEATGTRSSKDPSVVGSMLGFVNGSLVTSLKWKVSDRPDKMCHVSNFFTHH